MLSAKPGIRTVEMGWARLPQGGREIGPGVGASSLACPRLLALPHSPDMEQVAAFVECPHPTLMSGSQTWPWFMG